jgi:hypothetical protein
MIAAAKKISCLKRHLNFTAEAKNNTWPLHGSGANIALEIFNNGGLLMITVLDTEKRFCFCDLCQAPAQKALVFIDSFDNSKTIKLCKTCFTELELRILQGWQSEGLIELKNNTLQ